MAKARFTDKQKLFIAAYFTCGLNATEAAALAGYGGNRATLAAIGSENLRKPKIRAEIDRRLEEEAMKKDEVLFRLSDQARGTMADFVDPETGQLSLTRAEERGKLHLIKKLTHVVTETDGGRVTERVTIELHDAQTALVQVGRAYRLFVDGIDVTSGGEPIETDDNIRQDIQRGLDRIAESLEKGRLAGEPDDGAA